MKTKTNIDIESITRNCVDWIKHWFDENGKDSPAVIGISGGKDSSVVAALCTKALGRDRVIGVMIPDGNQTDIEDSRQIIKFLGIRCYEVNISKITEEYKSIIESIGLESSRQFMSNMPARVRMNVLYSIAQNVNGRVANTCNLSEDYIGWSTKWGDSTGDFAPINHLTATEVVAIGKCLKLPSRLVSKTPTDGLCGQTDEDKLGFSYGFLDAYIRQTLVTTGDEQELVKMEKIRQMHDNPNTAKKLYGIDCFDPFIKK